MADNVARVCVECKRSYAGPTRRGRCNACRNRLAYHDDIERRRASANQRAYYLKHKYGLDREAYDLLLEKQGGVCAICGGDQPGYDGQQRFHVDHDHDCCPGFRTCGKCVRGLLCAWCNVGLARFRDNPVALQRAIDYLGGDRP